MSEFQIVDSAVHALLDRARVAVPFRVEEACRKDSLDLTENDRADVVSRVAAAPERRIVVTHGTDTMTETARALSVIAGKTNLGFAGGTNRGLAAATGDVLVVIHIAPDKAAKFVEAEIHRMKRGVVAEMPFADQGGAISGLSEQSGYGQFFR